MLSAIAEKGLQLRKPKSVKISGVAKDFSTKYESQCSINARWHPRDLPCPLILIQDMKILISVQVAEIM